MKSVYFVFVTLLIYTFQIDFVIAGADSSGGGEIIGDRINPWFIENTKEVSYCIDIDSQSFSLDRDHIARLTRFAIEYWQRQLYLVQKSGYTIKLGTQKFIEHAQCSSNLDVHFQFGRLQNYHRSFLVDSRKFVGVAIRTDYDPKNLKGRGFVYISPDNGQNRFEGNDFESQIWEKENGLYLKYIIIHELGHIFGVPHIGATGMLMEASFPEALVKKSGSHLRNHLMSIPPSALIFDPMYSRIQCGRSHLNMHGGLDYLGVRADCIKLVAQENGNFELFESQNSEGPWQEVGTFKKNSTFEEENLGASFVTLYLTAENLLFPLSNQVNRRESILGVKRYGANGIYQIQRTFEKRSINVTYTTTSVRVDGVLNGLIKPNIFWLDF